MDTKPASLTDAARLEQLGYKQELRRAMGLVSSFGIAASIVNPTVAFFPAIAVAITTGGSKALLISFPIVTILCFFVSMSMAEIVSAYPTSGGLYYWSANLAGPRWAPLASYITGYFNYIGLSGITTAVAFIFGQLFAALLYVSGTFDGDTALITYQEAVVAGALISIILSAILCSFPANVLDKISKVMIVGNLIAWLILVIATPVGFVRNGGTLVTPTAMFSEWINVTGLPDSWAVCVACLASCFFYTGYDSAAHMAEETQNASRSAPFAIMLTVAVGLPMGYLVIWAQQSVLPPDLWEVYLAPNSTSIIVDVWVNNMGANWAYFLTVLLMLQALTVVVGCLATQARILFAFARDGAVPASNWLHSLTAAKVPLRTMLVSAVFSFILTLPVFGSTVAYSALVGFATIGTYLAYASPIFLRILRGNKMPKGPFSLGVFGLPVAIIAFLFLTIASVFLCLPTVLLPNPKDGLTAYFAVFNFAPIMVGIIVVLMAVFWIFYVRFWFKGPKLEIHTAENFGAEGIAYDAKFGDMDLSQAHAKV
ncbi:hypothetical protein SmJEL517_g06072 [Synchytrium microbalum]|uniref:Amino acid permease/ SLC12A domain-containing protein n=1 Tax=Synchytrium microbalum TaxID=1806994 RepID=A0A507BTC2_9FUNG|nr:uncharacterized protein SmJEL517_g06072 [Synchytrium microbalum]TPX30349.1 hypothetical protein SmJEL517_g06072 [Synchytrium microbalum]